MLSTLLPAIVPQQSVKPFNFYFGGRVCKGMNHQGKLYRFSHAFGVTQRSEAFVLACKLLVKGTEALVTVSQESYSVWVDLRLVDSSAPASGAIPNAGAEVGSEDASPTITEISSEISLDNTDSSRGSSSSRSGWLLSNLGQLFEPIDCSWAI